MKLNVSAAKAFLTDQLDWYYAYHLRRVPKGHVMPLALGTVWHILMEYYARTTSKEAAKHQAQLEIYEILNEAPQDEWAEDFQQEVEMLFNLFDLYEDNITPDETLLIEEPIEMPLGVHTLVGRPDRVIRYQDKFWHVQNRTLSDRTNIPIYLAAAERDLHELAYAALICHKYGVETTEYGGTLMNIVRKVSRKKLVEAPNAAFVQEFIPISPVQVREGLLDLEQIVCDMAAILDGTRRAVSNRDTDKGRFGNRISPYFTVKMGRISIDDDAHFKTVKDRYEPEVTAE